MNTHITKCHLILVWLALLMPLSVCAATLSSDAIEGKVLEEGTNKPISSATIVVRWTGHAGYSGTVCEHVETATTDEQGHYQIPAWRKTAPLGDLSNRQWIPIAYKLGYEAAKYSNKTTVYLKLVAGTRRERLEYLQRLSSAAGCYSAGKDEKNLLALRKALYDEARQLARPGADRKIIESHSNDVKIIMPSLPHEKTDKEILEYLLYEMEIIEFGYETAEKRDLQRQGAKQ